MKSTEQFSKRRCLGTKVPASEEQKSGAKFEYRWKSFEQVHLESLILASALQRRHLYSEVSDEEFGVTLQVLGICSVNREEWLMTDLAANLLRVTSVPLYETLGHATLLLILQQTKMQTLFGNEKSLIGVLNMVLNEDVFLKNIVTFDPISDEIWNLCQKKGLELLSYH
mmetsp:Transcript_39427/g.29115  ORF Transcript_39427/g.29115 Transcript_39427/m.29115 type:complete len:169 (+) Transcript_39427:145-651(+)